MPTQEQVPLVQLAEVRQAVYHLLRRALAPPTPGQHAWMRGPSFRDALETACRAFDLFCPEGEQVAESFADFESGYLACFEVGVPAPPVPLLASHYNRHDPTPRVVHEHLLFYRRFGAALPAGGLEPADHLLNEVAFVLRLDELLCAGRVEAESLLHARRDFLSRHLARWPARAVRVAQDRLLPPVYLCLLRLLAVAVAQDLDLTQAAIAEKGPQLP